MVLSTAYLGHAPVNWNTVTEQRIIDEVNGHSAQIAAKASGIAGWIRGFPAVATTTEARIMNTYADVLAGRTYECALMGITPDQGNTKATEFRMRYTTNGALPTTGSTTMAITLRLSQFELGAIRALFVSGSNQRLWIAAFISSLDGQNVRCWAPGDGSILTIIDQGPSVGQVGSVP